MRRFDRFLLLILSMSLYSSAMVAQCYQNCITVTGTGTATADADLAIVRVGYKLYGRDAKRAYAAASDTSNAILRALTESGIPKSAIESSSQVIQHTAPYEFQQMPMDNEGRLQRQFTVAQSWTIRVKPDEAGSALNIAINAGANESGWIEWVMENPTVLEAQASAQALANARMIAEQMVRKSDVHLGHLVHASENRVPMMNRPFQGAVAGMLGGAGMGQGGVATPPLAINSRRVEYNVSMYVVFAID
jgi:hypothetical protein